MRHSTTGIPTGMADYVPLLLLTLVASLASAQFQPHCASGRDGKVIVHLFSWTWSDIANECENVLGPKGFCGVQVSPPNEHRIVTSPNRPWWERYQPVSYKLDSSSGTRSDFIDMVERCNQAGVRIYIDGVLNHMAGVDSGSGYGTGGSYYNTHTKQFDGVPYEPNDFGTSCTTPDGQINDYGDVNQVRNCALVGLMDLNGGSDYVRGKIADYLNDMIDIGIDGLRIDAAKHMWPADISGILSKTKTTRHGGAPFVFQEVIDLYGSEAIKSNHYTHIAAVTEFKFGLKMGEIFQNNQVALQNLQSFGSTWGMLPSDKALVFVDNHDNQRGHGGGGDIITHKNSRAYKMATIFMLSWPYGIPRVMSSYDFTEDWTGPPSGAPGTSGICLNGWICEHRWRQITNMVEWRNQAGAFGVNNWWTNGGNQMAYSRGSASFIAFNKNDGRMDEWLTTGLPSGTYCDVISGNLEDGLCTGQSVTVGSDSRAHIVIDGQSEDPVVAIHLGSRTGGVVTSIPGQSTSNPVTPDVPPTGRSRTIVLIEKQTAPGEDVFLRGGCRSTNCIINIEYVPKTGSHFTAYNNWRIGDARLDWTGAENGQGSYSGVAAQGSPMAWTSNIRTSDAYDPANTYGDHYWIWEVYMDCSQAPNGYFEVKGYLNGQWEADISQSQCVGPFGTVPAAFSASRNHIARCGYKNVFRWNTNTCLVEALP